MRKIASGTLCSMKLHEAVSDIKAVALAWDGFCIDLCASISHLMETLQSAIIYTSDQYNLDMPGNIIYLIYYNRALDNATYN